MTQEERKATQESEGAEVQGQSATPPPDEVPAPTGDPAQADGEIGAESLLPGDAERWLDPIFLKNRGEELLVWAQDNILTIDILVQFGILIGALVPAALFGPGLRNLIRTSIVPMMPVAILKRAASALSEIATPIALFLTLQVARTVLGVAGIRTAFVEAGISLLSAWIVIRLVTLVIRSPFWSKVAFYIAWPVAALDAFGVLDNLLAELERISFPIGQNDVGETIRFSALDAIRVLIVFALFFWVANLVKSFVTARIRSVDELTPSFKALLIKIINILTPILALLMALQVVGFNLATLTIFGGAIGLGIGLGLQKTIANFIAGFTLVADKSIKPGDVVSVADTFGWVTDMKSRYVTVRTRDGTEHLVPNDKFIEDGVVNWSHRDNVVRQKARIGVSYATKDLRAVKKLCEEEALKIDRVLNRPVPVCNLMEFGDSSVNFELRFWIDDPANGLSNVRSDVMLAIWDRLMAENIEIPFPQRDLHIKSVSADIDLPRARQTRAINGEGVRPADGEAL